MALDKELPAPSAFREMIDALTDGCGCACHTGAGYNSSCSHCAPVPSPSTVDEARQALALWGGDEFDPLVDALVAAVRREVEQEARDRVMRAESWWGYEKSRADAAEAALASERARAEAERTHRERLEEAARVIVDSWDGYIPDDVYGDSCVGCEEGREEAHLTDCKWGQLRAALAAAPGDAAPAPRAHEENTRA